MMSKSLVTLFLFTFNIAWTYAQNTSGKLSVSEDVSKSREEVYAEKYYELALEIEHMDTRDFTATLHRAREFALKDDPSLMIVKIDYQLSEGYARLGNFDSAFYFADNALKDMRRLNLPEPYPSMLLGNKGNVFSQVNLHDSALYYHERALEALQPDDMEGIAFGLMNYASVLVYAGQLDLAEKNYKRALKVAADSNITQVLPNIIQNMMVLNSKRDNKLSQSHLDTLMDLARNSPVYSKGIILSNLASVLVEMNELEKAEPIFTELRLEDGNFVTDELGATRFAYACYLKGKGRYGEALALLKAVYRDHENSPHTGDVLRHSAEVFCLMAQPDSCVKYYTAALQWEQQKAEAATKEYIARSESSIKVIEARHLVDQSLLKQELLQSKITQQRWWIGLLVIIAFLTALAFVLYLKVLNKSRQIKERELQHRQARVTEMSLKLAQKNELMKELEEQFSEKRDGDSADLGKWKQKVAGHLKRVANTEKDWENLSLYLEDQYKGFYENLKARHPELTNNDLRLCTLARMRMSIKEMAGVLNLSVDSVKSNRYRLRKKMGLPTDTDLSDYLSDF